mmetsp:Transcript_44790/g.112340  ORF Transcript_44790/g.112340 Transcript_44790/m.112340 type:complete len:569 (+) Transcript_44790:199-1905(+)
MSTSAPHAVTRVRSLSEIDALLKAKSERFGKRALSLSAPHESNLSTRRGSFSDGEMQDDSLQGCARMRYVSLDADDGRSSAATITPSLSDTPAKRDHARDKPAASATWDGKVSGSLDAEGVDALLFLIEMHDSPTLTASRPKPPAHARPVRLHDETMLDTPSASRVDHHMRAASAGSAQQDAPVSCFDNLAVRARREMWRLNPEEIVLEEKLGEGDCAVVHKARWRSMAVVSKQLREVNEYTSINCNPSESPPSGSCLSAERARADLANEVDILSHLRHPNLVLFLGACMTEGGGLCLVSEYMEGGTLESLYQREQETLGHPFCPPRNQVLAWAQDLSQALCFLHNCQHPVIHRDIKPANLLLCRGILKVGDFGLSKVARRSKSTSAYRMTGRTGTMRYMAPEVMKMDMDGSSSYDEKVDIYSAAFIVWFMCMGEQPFGNLPPETVMQGVTRGLRPDLYSVEHKHGSDVADLIRDGWAVDSRDRMSGEEMVARVKKARADSEGKQTEIEQRKSKGSRGRLVSQLSQAKKMWSKVTGGTWASRKGLGKETSNSSCDHNSPPSLQVASFN